MAGDSYRLNNKLVIDEEIYDINQEWVRDEMAHLLSHHSR